MCSLSQGFRNNKYSMISVIFYSFSLYPKDRLLIIGLARDYHHQIADFFLTHRAQFSTRDVDFVHNSTEHTVVYVG